MTRPAIEVADVVRAKGRQFLERFKAILSYQQLKAFRAVLRCRTAALGGHKDKCVDCQYEAPISYNSCRSRSCPKCQAQARRRWLEAQQRDLLNTNYFHVVFTVPHELNPLVLTTPKRFFDLLFQASSQTLLEVAADPKRLGAEIGFLCILHTWSQNLLAHHHVHCVVPAGGLSADHRRWIHTNHPLFLLPGTPVLRTAFRNKFLDLILGCSSAGAFSIAEVPQPISVIMHGSSKWLPCWATRDGSSMPSLPSVAQPMCCAISVAIPTASPSPTIACWPSTDRGSPSDGAIMPTAASSA